MKKDKNRLLRPKRPASLNTLMKMLIEWHKATTNYEGNYQDWWDKYPSYSLKNVIDLAEKKLKP